ncbi:MAG TPA: alpha/beta fold hydrolase [Candidatus Acidoferrum sp.]|nr:alpha/beta fold hydrolase [Candidatus Acidoferrum sp.]
MSLMSRGGVWRIAFVSVVVVGGFIARALVGMATPGSDSPRVYDDAGVVGADYSGLPAPRMLSARDGTPLAARVYAASRDVVVVAIHGSSGRGRYFHPLATYLSERGVATVYALDLRGHGESGGRRGDVDYIGQLDDDLADVLSVIRRERPAARIVLLGHSAGGALVLRYAGRAAGPSVDGYVLLAPYLGPDAPTTKVNAGGWARPDVPKIRELADKAARGDTSGQDAIVLRFSQPAESADPLQVLAYSFRMMASLSPGRDLARDLGALRQPLLVLAGARDESFFAERYEPTIAPHLVAGRAAGPPSPPTLVAAGDTAGAAQNTRATFTVLPNIGHLGVVVHRRTAEEVAGWLGRLP